MNRRQFNRNSTVFAAGVFLQPFNRIIAQKPKHNELDEIFLQMYEALRANITKTEREWETTLPITECQHHKLCYIQQRNVFSVVFIWRDRPVKKHTSTIGFWGRSEFTVEKTRKDIGVSVTYNSHELTHEDITYIMRKFGEKYGVDVQLPVEDFDEDD